MKVSTKGLALIKAHEGFRAEAYPDAGYGWSRTTIGYGHTSQAGPPLVRQGMVISKVEATRILQQDLEKFEKIVNIHVRVNLTQNQFDALVSLCFNIGPKAFSDSTLLRKLNAGDFAGAANEFTKWRKSNGKVFAGLVKRRSAEKALFTTGLASMPEDTPVGAELDEGTKPIKSTTNWSAFLQAILANIGAFAAFDWKTALVIAIPATLLMMWIIHERNKHSKEGLV